MTERSTSENQAIPSVQFVKMIAKSMRKVPGCEMSHSQCLNFIVKQYGFKSFTAYLYHLNPERQKGDGNPITERNRNNVQSKSN